MPALSFTPGFSPVIILGCTEIGMLISTADSPVPTFDTTQIHAEAAAEYALTKCD